MKTTLPYSNIIVTGSISWDIIMNFPSKFVDYLQPDMLHQINVSFVVNSLEKQMGGTGTNISFAVSQTAKQISRHKQKQVSVYLLGGLGKDGSEQMKFFKKNGIKTEGIVSDKNLYCASGTVITDMKDNQIWGFYYGACTRGKDVNFKRFVKKDSMMIISANHPDAFLKAQQYAIANKIAYMYDCGMAMSWIQKKDLQKGIENSSWLIGNDYEIALICKTLNISVKDLVKKGIKAITTLGELGVKYDFAINSAHYLSHKTIQIPAYRVKKVIDPTGAGDAWRGGFLAAFCLGMDVLNCLKIGNVMASFAIESYGTVNYKVSKKEFKKRLNIINYC